jgi:hypothetical protein
METIAGSKRLKTPKAEKALPIIQDICSFEGYDADLLMKETGKLRELITKRGTLEILIPLCCTTDPVRLYLCPIYLGIRCRIKKKRQKRS